MFSEDAEKRNGESQGTPSGDNVNLTPKQGVEEGRVNGSILICGPSERFGKTMQNP